MVKKSNPKDPVWVQKLFQRQKMTTNRQTVMKSEKNSEMTTASLTLFAAVVVRGGEVSWTLTETQIKGTTVLS